MIIRPRPSHLAWFDRLTMSGKGSTMSGKGAYRGAVRGPNVDEQRSGVGGKDGGE